MIPESLKRAPRWVVVWYPEGRPGFAPKTPFRASDPTVPADSTDPATWASYETASETVARHPEQLILGFVLGGGYVGVDLDGCRDNELGVLDTEAREIVERLDSYAEISPSGTGVHILCKGKLPPGKRRRKGIEMYDSGRYFTVTGDVLRDGEVEDRTEQLTELHRETFGEEVPDVTTTELPPSDESLPDESEDLALIEKACTEFGHAEKFSKLWNGDISDYDDDPSRAIAAHLHQLAWLLGRNPERIDRMFRQSGLFEETEARRQKWDTRRGNSTWGATEIRRAIARTTNVYHGDGSATIPLPPRKTSLVFTKPAVAGDIDDFVLLPRAERFDGWWPRGSVHLVGGSSGTGKSTVTLVALMDQRDRKMVLGHQGAGLPFIVVTVDRQRLSNLRTLVRLGYREDEVPMRPLVDPVMDDYAAQAIVDLIEAEPVMPKVVFIEGMDFLVEEINKIRCVGKFMHNMQLIAEHYHIAIVGSVGSPKTKSDSQYQLTRDMIAGTGGWSRKAEDVAMVTFEDPEDGNGCRLLTIEHRNGSTERFTLEFKGGRLVETERKPVTAGDDSPAGRVLAYAKERGTFRAGAAQKALDMNGSHLKKQLGQLVRSGQLRKHKENSVEVYSYVQPELG